MKLSAPALAAALILALPARAEELPVFTGEEIIVTATRVPLPDVNAPYASEVHTRRMIEQSGAASLSDYLAQHTSLQLLPYFGNRATPAIDMRGYGIGDGYQNVVITLDGRRLNNIDQSPQLLGAIPVGEMERVEITKGSGSVMSGDGATAGTIQIYTRPRTGAYAQISAGNFGARNVALGAGLAKERVSLSVGADYESLAGYSKRDIAGYRDESLNRNLRGKLEVRPMDKLKLKLDGAHNQLDTRYVGPLTLTEFNSDPAQNSGNTYTHLKTESDVWDAGVEYRITPDWKLSASHHREDKLADNLSFTYRADYDYRGNDIVMQYRNEGLDLTAGWQSFDGTRIGSQDRTSKNNSGAFLHAHYQFGPTTLSAGGRVENVDYVYRPKLGASRQADHDLAAWEIGANHRFNDQLTLFANYNRAFQAPDIDRFFNFGGTFNRFIAPAKSDTFNLGVNHVMTGNRLKLTLFHASLKDEIYLEPFTFVNTNLDKTHKYGLELQDEWRVSPRITASLNYAYTRALIDREDAGGGAFNDKELPGVPKHGVVLGLVYRPFDGASLNLNHTWRSKAWAAADFDNNNAQKQAAFQSSKLAFHYRKKNLEWFAAVDNVFERKNGMWIGDDQIYPVSFTRNWRLGMKITY